MMAHETKLLFILLLNQQRGVAKSNWDGTIINFFVRAHVTGVAHMVFRPRLKLPSGMDWSSPSVASTANSNLNCVATSTRVHVYSGERYHVVDTNVFDQGWALLSNDWLSRKQRKAPSDKSRKYYMGKYGSMEVVLKLLHVAGCRNIGRDGRQRLDCVCGNPAVA